MITLAGILWRSDFFGSGPGFDNRTQSDPGFVNLVRSGPGFVNPIRSDPVQVLLTPPYSSVTFTSLESSVDKIKLRTHPLCGLGWYA